MHNMRRVLAFVLSTLLMLAFASAPVAAAPAACPTSWELATVHDTAVDFYPHLLPGQFETAVEFEAFLGSLEDNDGDGDVCVQRLWGYDLNPKSHWYLLGFEVGLNEPVHVLPGEGRQVVGGPSAGLRETATPNRIIDAHVHVVSTA